jgi:hypothetical protein
MSTVIKGYTQSDQNTILLKGAPERIINKCATYKIADGSIKSFSDLEKQQLINNI